jgi:hypothetical protein
MMMIRIGDALINMDLVRSVRPLQTIQFSRPGEAAAGPAKEPTRTIGVVFRFDEDHKQEIIGPDLFEAVCKRLGMASDLLHATKPQGQG